MTSGSTVALVSVAHDLGDGRISRLCKALSQVFDNVLLVGLGAPARAPDSVRVRALGSSGPLRRLARAVVVPWQVRADVIVVVDPELFVTARFAGRLRRIPVVCDVHEDYDKVVEARSWARTGLVRWLARWASRAAVCSAAGADLTLVADDHVPPLEARDRLVVRNLPAVDPDLAVGPAELRAVYVGDASASRGLFEMVEGILAAPSWELDIIGPIEASDRACVLDRVGDSPRIRVHGRLAPTEAWRLAAGASVGLALLHPTPAYRDAMPTKLYEYAAVGLAVVTSSNPRPAAAVMAAEIGAVVTGPSELAARLAAWRERPDQLVALRRRAHEWAVLTIGENSPFDQAAKRIATLYPRRMSS